MFGGPHGGLDHPCAYALGNAVELGAELLVAVSNKESRRRAIHRGVAQLLRGPLLGRVLGGGDVDHLARTLVHQEEKKAI